MIDSQHSCCRLAASAGKSLLEQNDFWYFFDNRNKILSVHYDDIGTNNEMFREKMKKRFEQIDEILLNADKICFICNRNADIDVFKYFLNEIGKIYPGKITLINIRNGNAYPASYNCFEEKISEKLVFIEYEFEDIHPEGGDKKMNKEAWKGNYIIWDTIMHKMSLSKKKVLIPHILKQIYYPIFYVKT